MALLEQAFNAQQFDPTQGAGQLPLGKHPVIITESDVKANKDLKGGHVEFTVKIMDGPAVGQSGAYRLNMYHQNAKTVEIANRQFSALCHVTGQLQVVDTQQLHNIPFVIEVTNQKLTEQQLARQQEGEVVAPYTQISKVYYMDGTEPGKEGQAPAQAQPQQAVYALPAQQQPQGFAAPAQSPAPAAAWQNSAPAAQAPAQAPAAAPAAAWSQGGAAQAPATKPAWGR